MSGIALKLYREREGKEMVVRQQHQQWPFLHALMVKKQIPYIDYAVALQLLPSADEAAAAFICYLSLASREGHLCVSFDGKTLTPSPDYLWPAAEGEDPDVTHLCADDLKRLTTLIAAGATILPPSLFEGSSPLLYKENGCYYFQRHWRCEKTFLTHFLRLKQSIPSLAVDSNVLSSFLSTMKAEGRLLEEQAAAISNAATHSLSILCGGPGTGKTYTAGILLKALWAGISEERRKYVSIAIAAPTGKAAMNLQLSLQKALGNDPHFPSVKAKTLHSLLGRELTTGSLEASIIIVDECSMVDVALMAKLFAAVRSGARLLLLGDPFQLPSVEAGSLFADIVDACKGSAHLTLLHRSMRTEMKSILSFASAVNEGNVDAALACLDSDSTIEHFPIDEDSRKTVKQLVKTALPHFSHRFVDHQDPMALLQEFSKYRILSPLRQGPLGVNQLNALFLKTLAAKHVEGTPFAAPIMITSNHYKLDLFNGEVGLLVRKSDPFSPFEIGDYALFPPKEGEAPRKVPAVLLPPFEYAYCLSVHKSQGSEFEEVVFLLPQGAEVFGREGLYTAITRAKTKLTLWTDKHIFVEALKHHSRRHSGISGQH